MLGMILAMETSKGIPRRLDDEDRRLDDEDRLLAMRGGSIAAYPEKVVRTRLTTAKASRSLSDLREGAHSTAHC